MAFQKVRVLIAGRGVGKSTLIAWIIYEMLRVMGATKDRLAGKIFFASTTLEQIKNSMLPPIKKKWLEMGLKEGVHYVVDVNPPDWFDEPYSKPEDYTNSLTFWNGFTIMFLSTTRPSGKRGGSYDAGIVDEAAFMPGKFRAAFFPMIRDNLYKFDTHWHHSLILLSSRPRTAAGNWIYDLKKEAETNPKKVLWMEGSALENKDVLGEDWFEDQKLVLGDDYEIEVENKELRKLPTGFFHNMDRGRHAYRLKPGDNDLRSADILEVSFDFGGKFNCCSVWQEHEHVERCINQFYVKREGKVNALVDKFCAFYRHHPMKFVRIWGEPRGHDSDPGRPSLYDIIVQRFEFNGWGYEVKVQPGKRTSSHKAQYSFMEQVHAGTSPALPAVLYNEEACPNILRSMELCDIRDDYSIVKDTEKDPNYPQEDAPHFSQTVTYYLLEKHGWRLLANANSRAGGVW